MRYERSGRYERYEHATRIVKLEPLVRNQKPIEELIDETLASMGESGFEFVQAVQLVSAPQKFLLIFKKPVGSTAVRQLSDNE